MSDNRSILDTILQSSAVELFHANGIAVAPIARTTAAPKLCPECHPGLIGFVGRGFSGTLLILVPNEVFLLLKQDGPRPFRAADWVRELTNQLLGRLKARLRPYQVTFRMGIPSSPRREEYERMWSRGESPAVYRFRTVREDVVVIVNGSIDVSALVYAGNVKVPTEGDILLF